jgi:hypothetical protein
MNETPVVSFPLLTHEVDICAQVGPSPCLPPYPLSCFFPHGWGLPPPYILPVLSIGPQVQAPFLSSLSSASSSLLLEQFLVLLLKVIKLSRHLINRYANLLPSLGSCVIALGVLLYLLLAPSIHLTE